MQNEQYYKKVLVRDHKRKSAQGVVCHVIPHYRYIPVHKVTIMNNIKKRLCRTKE